nr:zinc finger, CCHC-type [Tanacetum cinerariifolium]
MAAGSRDRPPMLATGRYPQWRLRFLRYIDTRPNGTKGLVDGSSSSLEGQNMFNKIFQVYYVTYVSEAYFVQDDDVAWRVDSRAIVHVCKDRCWFKTYDSLNNRSILHIGNESTTLVHGRGCVDLKLSSGKIVLLFNVLHVPNIRNNLVAFCLGLRFALEALRFVSEDLAFCLQNILRFVFRRSCVLSSEDLVFCLQKILRFVFRRSCVLSSEDLAFCLQKILRFVFRRSCVLSQKILRFVIRRSYVLSLEDLAFCLQKILHFVFKDLVFCL